MLDSTANLYSFMPPTINQSERDYSVRHDVRTYAILTNQSAAIAYVTGCVRTRFNQSEHGYSVRHAAYVTVPISAAPCGGLRRPAVSLRRPMEACGALRYPSGALKKRVENLLLYY